MKPFAAAIMALIIISGLAAIGLNSGPFSIENKTSSDAVRLG